MCNLDEMKGLHVGKTYRNHMQAANFVAFTALKAFDDVARELKSCKFYSIMGDDSTDVGACEQSMWFVRSAKKGKINIRFLGNKTLDRADAERIINGVKELVDVNLQMKWQAFMDKVLASTTDGASVTLGRVGGVCVRLQAYQPSMIIVHCMAHRLELAWGDACKRLPIYDKSIKTLAVLFLYEQSPEPSQLNP